MRVAGRMLCAWRRAECRNEGQWIPASRTAVTWMLLPGVSGRARLLDEKGLLLSIPLRLAGLTACPVPPPCKEKGVPCIRTPQPSPPSHYGGHLAKDSWWPMSDTSWLQKMSRMNQSPSFGNFKSNRKENETQKCKLWYQRDKDTFIILTHNVYRNNEDRRMVEQWKVKYKCFQGIIEKMMKANLFQIISFTFKERY